MCNRRYSRRRRTLGATIPQTTGSPGIGAHGTTTGSFTQVAIGHHDTVVPLVIATEPVGASILPYSVSMQWPATTDDANGIGMFVYEIFRNGTQIGGTYTTEFADSTSRAPRTPIRFTPKTSTATRTLR
jgi:hypothetical protein